MLRWAVGCKRGVAVLSAVGVLGWASSVVAAGETVRIVDATGNVGSYTSLQLDGSGFPVISYFDHTSSALKVVRCNDAACDGGDETSRTLDSTEFSGQYSSLQLDASGFPVISYQGYEGDDGLANGLKVVHCNDALCDGGDETFRMVDTGGLDTSLQLDASGFPVISYSGTDGVIWTLNVVHCNDAACAGGDETIRILDVINGYGVATSLRLDGSGFPVISYTDTEGGTSSLKVVHCNDALCDGGDETIRMVDSPGVGGFYSSLQLDGSGFPVISYFDSPAGALKVVHCNDPACDGGDETIRTVDDAGYVGLYSSLQLDASGFPVISYHGIRDGFNADLKVAHCNDAACDGGDETLLTVDSAGYAGRFTSLQLDASGRPVVSYYVTSGYAFADGDLVMARCDDPGCVPDNDGDGVLDVSDNCSDVVNPDQLDTDADTVGDACDDDDGDGVSNAADAFPLDPAESVDTDADGVGNNADIDDDGDGQRDTHEVTCGSNPISATSTSVDTDGDTLPDCVDSTTPPTSQAAAMATLPATGADDRQTSMIVVGVALLLSGLALTRVRQTRG